jgi:hypothetical protein
VVIRLISSLTNGILESVWSVWLLTYHGALNTVLSILDCTWCVEHRSQYFGLHSLYDFCVGRFGTAPKLYTVGPYRFNDRFVQ